MKAIKMYWNNTTLIYKIIALLFLPLVVVLTSRIPILAAPDGSDSEFSVISFGLLIGYILLEVFTDGWNFGGIYGKEFRGIELVKASTKGHEIVWTDADRRWHPQVSLLWNPGRHLHGIGGIGRDHGSRGDLCYHRKPFFCRLCQ